MDRPRAYFVLPLLAVFIVFHIRAVRVYFTADDGMNWYGYWEPPVWKIILANILFWSKFVRPLGALYYLPLYKLFGANPVPFNIIRLLLLLINTLVFWRLARWIVKSEWVAALAAVPVAYHAGLGYLTYSGAFIYDVLCGGFYFAALLYYVRSRRTQGSLGWGRSCIFLALYICALNSKEMAVSLPVVVLAYELFLEGRQARLGPAFAAAAVTAVFILGKTIGPGTLTEIVAYRPVLTWARFAESNTRFLNTIFYTEVFTIRRVLLLWTVLLYVGVRKWRLPGWDPRWLFLWTWVVVTPLPLAFLPGRGGAMLYIVVAGWAMVAAMTAESLVRGLLREPLFRKHWLGRIPQNAFLSFALLLLAGAYVRETRRIDRWSIDSYLANGADVKELVRQLKELGVKPAARSRIIFLDDPFPNGFGTQFISSMVWNDHTLDVTLQRQIHLPPEAIAGMDYVFDFVDGRLSLLSGKRPIGNRPQVGNLPHILPHK